MMRASSGLSTRVYDQIRDGIVHGRFRPNQRLVESDLATNLEVSRTPIREALQRLTNEGLVVRTRQGWVVYEHTREEIRHIYEVRIALESYAARLAALRAREADKDLLTALYETADVSTELGPRDLVETNHHFHQTILALSQNPMLRQLAQQSAQYYFNYRLAASYTADEIVRSRGQHDAIRKAVLNGDPEAAETAAREHVELGLEILWRKSDV
jgi:DNA-binding GntR family transcriptional regulator